MNMRALVLSLAIAASAAPAWARFMSPLQVPVPRLLSNLGAYVKERPEDPDGWYLLGRVHGYAFALGASAINAYHAGGKGALPVLGHWQGRGKGKLGRTEHLIESIKSFRQAIRLEPEVGLYRLGLAWILSEGAALAEKVGFPPGEPIRKLAPPMKQHWQGLAAREALRAHDLVAAKDLSLPRQPVRGLSSMVSFEAGELYLKLVKELGPTAGDKAAIARVEANLRKLRAKPPGPITPVVLSLVEGEGATLDRLLAPGSSVRFDLDGDGLAERWPWLKPTTGLLVWDPDRRGRITSGRMLFGSVTWWMFWRDGYHALDALDDDRDGRLAGAELRGLGVWFDRNGNGRSDGGEVQPITELGVRALSVRATRRAGEAPFARTGLWLGDGRALPTFDWSPTPISR